MHIHLFFLRVSICLGLCAASAWAQTGTSDETPEEAAVAQAASAMDWTSAWGLGLFHYEEPGVMRLSGPEAALQLHYRPTSPGWPDSVQLDLGVASLAYSSADTGSMHAVPALTGRGTALWRFHASENAIWRAGLQLDMVWTDLRGTTSSGNTGYRRLGSKAWAVLQQQSAGGARSEIGVLLQGRQDSLLTDAGGSRDITNTQRQGMYLAHQHSPLQALWPGLRPWVRYSQVGKSNTSGGYYEPRNRTLQVGGLIDW